ncbi:pyruvate kinase alpha/beta domain-containing protein [Clostridium lundense]|uniref:pyruvate kinase alpha/beta domain-containing protein n=1 Tax=Clostridium lundense TaxID=319475 RepID=UPI000487FCA7|nr:pyruvate kinase alpha/beta domain-containing protein [Clostridium lundense]
MYFENPGKENTEKTVELAIKCAKEKGIKHIVVASNEGNTARLLKDCSMEVVVVTHAFGHKEPGMQEMKEEVMKELEGYGFKIYSGTHVLSGAERGISKKFGGVSPVEIIAQSLRMLGQGVKVGVEISTMALDAGLIPYGEDIITIGGWKNGADTALIVRPAYANAIFDTKIKEIICKPH